MLHFLLVEDNPGDVLLLREALRASSVSADVVIAYDGEQAERFLEELGDIALVVLDLNLPKVNGFEILEHYRAKHGQPLPSVIVLTGSENPVDEKRARELGASDYLIKPTGCDAFVAGVKSMIERWSSRADSAAVS